MDISYTIVTAAKNEADYIENLIKSVIFQTILPTKWVIVSDGSTDKTNEIVLYYSKKYPFIKLIAIEGDNTRNFGSHAKAFNAGCRQMSDIAYEYIGNLDADLTFEADYYEKLLRKFNANPKLGITGGMITERKKGQWHVRPSIRKTSVAGALQLFRKECFEQIGGGYQESLYEGGYDAVANAMARIKGWQVEEDPELPVRHHRPTGAAIQNVFHAYYQHGKKDYLMGKPPLFVILKSLSWCFFYKPYILGGNLVFTGYFSCLIRGEKRAVSKEVVRFFQKEQFELLKFFLKGLKSNVRSILKW